MTNLITTRYESIRREIKKVIVGQDKPIEQLLVGFLAGGHIILEGVPGLAKTMLAKALAASLSLQFRRVQFTPDLMPADLTGTNIFQPDKQQFKFLPGPLFADILLADEINRTPPKTQSALLEAMEERQITVDGASHALSEYFFVIATQNPVEYEGTFPLPEAQVDRFLLKVKIGYPSAAEEKELLRGGAEPRLVKDTVQPVATAAQLKEIHQAIRRVRVEDSVFDYLQKLVSASRHSPQIALGASPRAALGWLMAARVLAALHGRDFVTPDDLKEMAEPVLSHRLALKPEAQIEGVLVEQVIEQLLASVEVPR
jgi:MoxR-like ATPase